MKKIISILSFAFLFWFGCQAQGSDPNGFPNSSFGTCAFSDSLDMAMFTPTGNWCRVAYTLDSGFVFSYDVISSTWKKIARFEELTSIGGAQTLSIVSQTSSSVTVAISDGNQIVIPINDGDNDSSNEFQTLSYDNGTNNISISNGNSVDLSDLQDVYGVQNDLGLGIDANNFQVDFTNMAQNFDANTATQGYLPFSSNTEGNNDRIMIKEFGGGDEVMAVDWQAMINGMPAEALLIGGGLSTLTVGDDDVYIIIDDDGASGNGIINLDSCKSNGDNMRRIFIMGEIDGGTSVRIQGRDASFVVQELDTLTSTFQFALCACNFDGEWEIGVSEQAASGGGGGGSDINKVTPSFTQNTTFFTFWEYDLTRSGAIEESLTSSGSNAGSSHFINIYENGGWVNGDRVRWFNPFNGGASAFGFRFVDYNTNEIKGINGNDTATSVGGEPTMQANPDNNAYIEAQYSNGQWMLIQIN